MNEDYQQQPIIRSQTGLGAFYGKVYAFLAAGLALSGLTSFVLINFFGEQFASFLFQNMFVFYVLWIAELALVVLLSVKGMKNPTIAVSGFLAYSILNGITLSVTFLMYTTESIMSAFLVSAVTFGVMAAYGILTKRDLSGMGYAAMNCLIGILIVMVVNFFLKSSALVMFASIAMVLIFSGLTAYDNQKIKQFYLYSDDGVSLTGIAVFCALQLYLDFINLFLAFLRIFGKNN